MRGYRLLATTMSISLLVLSIIVAETAQAAGADTPRDLLNELAEGFKQGKGDQVKSLIDQSSNEGKKIASIAADAVKAYVNFQTLQKALADKFGDETIGQMLSGQGITLDDDLGIDQFDEAIKEADIQEQGDKATVTLPDEEEPLPLLRRGGRWYVDATAVAESAEGMLDPIGVIVKAVAKLSKDSLPLVDASDSIEDFGAKIQPQVESLMGQVMMLMFQAMGDAMAKGMEIEVGSDDDDDDSVDQWPTPEPVNDDSVDQWPTLEPVNDDIANTPQQQDAPTVDTAQHWADFNHYVKIARPDLADAAAISLLGAVDDAKLLAVVEAGDYKDWPATLEQAKAIKTLKRLAQQLDQRIQAARVAKSRDTVRINQNIKLLAGTLRQRLNAIERLRGAGQFAAPQLIAVLLDQRQARLHPHVETAIVAIGRPLVYPLSISLARLEPVQMSQVVQVLAEIGYPRALPYLKQVLEAPGTDPDTRRTVQTAFDALAEDQDLPSQIKAAELFLILAANYYEAGTHKERLPGYDSRSHQGIVWTYDPDAGLVPTPVQEEIFADVLTMRAARRSLVLDPHMDPALSLWLGANLRRENRLPADQQDRSLRAHRDPTYYARMAGPLRLHDVLDRALRDHDPDLALDAIESLQSTAGTDALINRRGTVQPLLAALSYPDRRVRFPAAFVITQTRPTSEFPGSQHVVTVLAEAVRQSELRHALALASDQNELNRLATDLDSLNYEVTVGRDLAQITDVINAGPGFDLIVVTDDTPNVEAVYHQASRNYKLAGAPILAVVSAIAQDELNMVIRDRVRFRAVLKGSVANLRVAVEAAAKSVVGKPITRQQAADYATTALRLLRNIATSQNTVYNVADAEPALIQALNDERQKIVRMAGQVLELIDSTKAQVAIAQASLDMSHGEEVVISLLNSLAESAKQFGNKLDQIHLDDLLDMVKSAEGQVALAVSRAHGALTLPTSNVVELIVE